VVTFKPRLAKKLKKRLRHGKKVRLAVYSTYRSPGGTIVSSSAKLVLQKTPKVKHGVRGRIPAPRIPLF
jgi:hypothetical protein